MAESLVLDLRRKFVLDVAYAFREYCYAKERSAEATNLYENSANSKNLKKLKGERRYQRERNNHVGVGLKTEMIKTSRG